MKVLQRITIAVTMISAIGIATVASASTEMKTSAIRLDTKVTAAASLDVDVTTFNFESTIREFLLAGGNSAIIDMPIVKPSDVDPTAWEPKEKFRGHNLIRGLS